MAPEVIVAFEGTSAARRPCLLPSLRIAIGEDLAHKPTSRRAPARCGRRPIFICVSCCWGMGRTQRNRTPTHTIDSENGSLWCHDNVTAPCTGRPVGAIWGSQQKAGVFDCIGQSRRFCDVPVTSATFATAAVKSTAHRGQQGSHRRRARFADKVA